MAQSALSKVALTILGIVGITCCVVGGIYYKWFPEMARTQIEEALPLKKGSDAYDRWTDSPVPLKWKWTFFNITNPEEMNQNVSAIPVLREVDTVVFRQKGKKMNVNAITRDNETEYYSYDDHRTYFYEPGNKSSEIDAEIYHLNIFYLIAVRMPMADFALKLAKEQLQKMVDNGVLQLVEKHTIRELLFEGYHSELIKQMKNLPLIAPTLNKRYPDNIFGLYYEKNDTSQSKYTINSGLQDVQDIGQIWKYNNKEEIGIWKDHCRQINGTDATLFHPGISKEEELFIFSSELQRSAGLVYEKEVAVEDIAAFKFILSEHVFDMSLPDNKCFCQERDKDTCVNGLLYVKDPDQPLIVSAPHFYNGDKKLLENMEGLEPDKDKHESYVVVEPNTGVTINAAKRVQINLQLKNVAIPLLENADGKFVPFAWIEESAQIDSESAQKFRSEVTNKLKTIPNLLIGLIALGAILTLISTVVCIYKVKRKR